MGDAKKESYFTKALIGGTSCAIAGVLLNPIDVVKVRMQNNSLDKPWAEKNMLKGMQRIFRLEGVAGLCLGARATILREMTYSTIRMGSYEPILNGMQQLFYRDDSEKKSTPSAVAKYASALLAGALGASVANPTDLIKVNFQAALQGHKLPYATTMGGFQHIYREEGVRGLYKGTVVTTIRAALVTSAAIGTYDVIKNNLVKPYLEVEDGIVLFSVCSMLAGVITTTAANPADVIKTRYMSDSVGKYSNPAHCLTKTIRDDGIGSLMKGWTPAYFRIGPYTIIAFVIMEQTRLLLGIGTL